MLESILITDDEMSDLPTGVAGFLAYESLCRTKLHSILNRSSEHDDTMDIRISYLTNVVNAASFYEVSNLQNMDFDPGAHFDNADARNVARKIDNEVSKLRFVALGEKRPNVALTASQTSKIDHLLKQLHQRVFENPDLDERKKDKLLKKIDELSSMFKGGAKPSLQATMVVIASIFTAINQGEAAVIKLPEVITAVLEIFGHAREDAEQKLLHKEVQKLIAHHGGEDGEVIPVVSSDEDLDDDIQF